MATDELYQCQMCNEIKTDDPELFCDDCAQHLMDEADRADLMSRCDWYDDINP